MKHLTFYFDPVSPFSYLAFERLPQVLAGLNFEVTYRPILFAGLLQHWGQKGPAEIGPKRDWTYRHVSWMAQRDGIAFALPAAHPFNPLALLRLAWACTPAGSTPNRHVCERLLQHAWSGGAAADDAGRLAALERALQPLRDPRGDEVKAALREATEAAARAGVFGVPTIEAEARQFWGYDALEMLGASLRGDPWFEAGWAEAPRRPIGALRRG